jgi:hypothetical protein
MAVAHHAHKKTPPAPKRGAAPSTGAAPKRIMPDWYAAGVGGIAGGLAFMLVEMVLAPAFRLGSPWDAPRLIAAVLFGNLLSGESRPFINTVSLFAHLTLSLIYARFLAMSLFRRPRDWPRVGLLFGLALYFLNYYVIGTFVARIAAERSGWWLLCHLVFGVVAAGVYALVENPEREL